MTLQFGIVSPAPVSRTEMLNCCLLNAFERILVSPLKVSDGLFEVRIFQNRSPLTHLVLKF